MERSSEDLQARKVEENDYKEVRLGKERLVIASFLSAEDGKGL